MSPASAPAKLELRNVFPGPRPFRPNESAIFFGRDQEVANLRDLVLSYPMLLLYARSGAGKTSLVNAKLLPILRLEGYTALVTRVGGELAQDRSLTALPGFNVHAFQALSLLAAEGTNPQDIARMSLAAYFGQLNGESSYCLILDQFEEFFTAHPDRWTDRKPFFLQIGELLRTNKNVHVLLVIREDYVASLDPFSDLAPGGLRFRYRLERLRLDQSRQAIEGPLASAGRTFESPEVVNDLLAELSKERIELGKDVVEVPGEFIEPMQLQVVCRNLTANLPEGVISVTRAHVSRYANVSQALSDYYNATVVKASKYHRQRVPVLRRVYTTVRKRQGVEARLRGWFSTSLITKAGTRGYVYLGEVDSVGLTKDVVRVIAEERVVQLERRAGAEWIELTHDRFIAPILSTNHAWAARRRRIATVIAASLFLFAIGLAGWYWQRQARTAAEKFAAQTKERAQRTESELKRRSGDLIALLTQWGFPATVDQLGSDEVKERLKANEALESLQIVAVRSDGTVDRRCRSFTIRYYPKKIIDARIMAKLTTTWNDFGFAIDNRQGNENPDLDSVAWNAVWTGADVLSVCEKAVELSLVRAGFQLRRLAPISLNPEGRKRVVQVGSSLLYDPKKPIVTVQEVLSRP